VAPDPDPLTPPFASKTAVVVRNALAAWQRLNVAAFLISAISAAHPELVGADYEDADGQRYLRMLGVPILIFESTGETLATARHRAVHRELPLAVYTRERFATGHDAETGQRYAPSPASSSTSWASDCTARRTRWTRSSREHGCTVDRLDKAPAAEPLRRRRDERGGLARMWPDSIPVRRTVHFMRRRAGVHDGGMTTTPRSVRP
jgi:hypothetical protein